MKDLLKWIAYDGLLHFLVCAVISLAVLCVTKSLAFALVAGLIPALAKEWYDKYIQKDNTWEQVWHDLACDLAGLTFTTIIYLIS